MLIPCSCRIVLKAADEVVELFQRAILDRDRAAASPGEADPDLETERIGEVALERRGVGVLGHGRLMPRGPTPLGEELGLADVETAADDLARHAGRIGGA